MKLTFVIQAGGQSSRMGQNKALMPFLGKPLIERIKLRAEGFADEILITSDLAEPYRYLDVPVLPDLLPGRGNLGGLYTAIASARHPLVAVVACDMPFVSTRLIEGQRDILLLRDADVVIPCSAEGLEPLHSLYRKETCLPAIRSALDENKKRMISWFPLVKVIEMSPDQVAVFDPDERAFINVNTPEEFLEAEQLAQEETPTNY